LKFLNGYALHEEPCSDPYARFCGQTEAAASSDPIAAAQAGRTRATEGNNRQDNFSPPKSNGSHFSFREKSWRACDPIGQSNMS
jgi:hypothetical protein